MKAYSFRPHPPPLLFLALGLWVGVAVSFYQFSLAQALTQASCFVISGLLLALGAFGLYVFRNRHKAFPITSLLILGLGLGVLSGTLAAASLSHQQKISIADQNKEYIFEIVEDLREGEFGSDCCARTVLSDNTQLRVVLRFSDASPALSFGDIICAKATLQSPAKSAQEYYWKKGVAAVAKVYSYEEIERTDLYGTISAIRSRGIELFPADDGEGSVLLRAILFGERNALNNTGFYQSIRVVGLAHLVAVSGAHLVIVSSFLGVIMQTLRLPRALIVLLQTLLVIAYLIFTGIPISALRAALMASISLFSYFGKRRASSLQGLSIAIVVMLMAVPASALSISFLLSVLSTFGIIVFNPLIKAWLESFFPRFPRALLETFGLSLAAGIPITLLCASLFSQISLISPLANIVAAPFFSVICLFGLIAVILVFTVPALGALILPGVVFVAQAFSELVQAMSQIPFAALPSYLDFIPSLVGSVLISSLLWAWWPRFSGLKFMIGTTSLGVSLFLYLVFSPYLAHDEIIMLDVGQGDAFVVRSQGKSILVDTGNRDLDLLSALGKHRIYSLDAIVISHADDDHCGSLSALQGYVRIGAICLAQASASCDCDSCNELIDTATKVVGEGGLRFLKVGDSLRVGAFTCEVIWPDKYIDEGGNADSLSLLLSAPRKAPGEQGAQDINATAEWKALFCGDAEFKEINSMITEGRIGDIDMLKIGHHGSKAALSKEIMLVLDPEIALISVGKNNRYGHPAYETLELLQNHTIFRTDLMGDVVCRLSREGIEIKSVG